jgi:hypothetical protein
MKIGEVILRVKSEYAKGTPSDDIRLSDRLVYNKLLTARGLLFHQKLKANRKISDWELQPIENVEMTKHNTNLMKTSIQLPAAVTYEYKNLRVLKGFHIIDLITIEESTTISGNKYTADNLWAYLYDNRIFINDMNIKKVNIYGLWRDPIKAYRLNNPTSCISNKEIEFFTPNDMIDTIITMTVNELIGTFNKEKEDITNNNRDSLIQETK